MLRIRALRPPGQPSSVRNSYFPTTPANSAGERTSRRGAVSLSSLQCLHVAAQNPPIRDLTMDPETKRLTWNISGSVSKIECYVGSSRFTVVSTPRALGTRPCPAPPVTGSQCRGRAHLSRHRDPSSTPGSAVEGGRGVCGHRGSGFVVCKVSEVASGRGGCEMGSDAPARGAQLAGHRSSRTARGGRFADWKGPVGEGH